MSGAGVRGGEIVRRGGDVLRHASYQKERAFRQHGEISVYGHSLAVAARCLAIADRLGCRVDRTSLVRGALLHDYFLYDWHEKSRSHRWHGFTHPKRALENAARDFALNDVERDMILRHMFPLTFRPPRTKEGAILCAADKFCALGETFGGLLEGKKRERRRRF